MPLLLSLLVYSELSVLLCALGLGALSQLLLGLPLQTSLLGFLGATAFFFYTLERNLTITKPEDSIFPEKTQWIIDHRILNGALLLLSGGFGAFLFFRLHFISQASFVSMGLLALAYSIIPIPSPKGAFALREVYYIKPLLLSVVWVFCTLFLPAIELGNYHVVNLSLLSIIWFSWIFSNGLLFDIRDLQIDAQENQTTLAMLLGRSTTHRWINIILVIQLIAVTAFSILNHNLNLIWILMLGSFSFWLCNYYLSKHHQASLRFFIFADLTLVLPGLTLGLITYY